MLIHHHFAGPTTLATCVSNPRGCDANQLAQILDSLQCGCPPDAAALKLLADGMAVGDFFVGTNPFFGNAGVVRAMRANAPANPDVAIVLMIRALDDFLATSQTLQQDDLDDRGFIAESIRLLADNVAQALPDQQARGLLRLKDLTGVSQTLPNTANRAALALLDIKLPTKSPSPVAPPSAPGMSRAKIALLAVTGAVAVGGGAVLLWQLGRRSRAAPRSRARRQPRYA